MGKGDAVEFWGWNLIVLGFFLAFFLRFFWIPRSFSQ